MTWFSAFCEFWFCVVSSASDCVFVPFRCGHRCRELEDGFQVLCKKSVRADCFKCVWCPYLRVSEHRCSMYPSESVGVFVVALQVQCWCRALFSDRVRLGAQSALIPSSVKARTSIMVHVRWAVPKRWLYRVTAISALFFRIISMLVISARAVFGK